MDPMKNRSTPLSDKKLQQVVGGVGGVGDTESPASVVCNHCGGTVSRSSTGWLGYTLYDCTCGWRTKYKGDEWIACFNPAVLDGCP